jgi:hypothetical protein
MVKSERVKRAEHVALMGDMRKAQRILVGNLKGRDNSEQVDVNGKLILEWILGK